MNMRQMVIIEAIIPELGSSLGIFISDLFLVDQACY